MICLHIEYDMQKVSVIIPTKNSGKTIRKCILAIKKQSYSAIEIIVVDNFSSDNTLAIAKKYADKVFSAAPERSAQRNYGVQKCTGAFVMLVDSDMYVSRNVIKECVEGLTKEYIGIYIPEKILGNSFWAEVRNFERGFYNSTCVDAARFLRKKDFEKLGGFDENLRVAEDWDFDRRLRMIGKTKEIYAHVFHDESSFAINKYIGKKRSYFDDLQIYQKKWVGHPEVKKQMGMWYRMVWVFIENNKWRRLFRHPILSVAMLLLRTMVGFEFLLSKIKFNNNQLVENSKNPTSKTWNAQWKHYNKAPFFKPNHKVIQEIVRCFDGKVTGKKILEIGAGSGCDILSLSKRGACGYALDFSSESVKTMRYWSKKTKTNIIIKQGDIRELPYDKPLFDMIYSVGLMEHFEDPIPLLQKQLSLLKMGGLLLIDVPQKYSLYTIAKHVRMRLGTHPFGWETEYSLGELRKISEKLNTKIVRFYGRDLDIIQKIPIQIRPQINTIYQKTVENSCISPYISLSIGMIVKK